MTVAAMITNLSLLNATVLTSTRMPFAMAEDGYLPVALTAKHRRYGRPGSPSWPPATIYALRAGAFPDAS
jgi:amino acid transporter